MYSSKWYRSKTGTVILVMLLFLSSLVLFSDDSDAGSLPGIDVRRSHDDSSLSGKGAILDGVIVDFDTESDSSGTRYIVRSGTVLVSGTTYLYLTGDSPEPFSLFGGMFVKNYNGVTNDFLLKTGVRMTLHTDRFCTSQPVASGDFRGGQDASFSGSLETGVRYYIKVSILDTVAFDRMPDSRGVGFSLTIVNMSVFTVQYFDGSIMVDERLVRNGDYWTFPSVTKEDAFLLGWYDVPGITGGNLYRTSDTVSLKDDNTRLYTRWWTGGSYENDYTDEKGNEAHISVDASEKGIIMDLEASSTDGSVIIDMPHVDLSEPVLIIDVQVTPRTGIFTVSEAESAVDLYDFIYRSLADKGVIPTADVNIKDGTVKAEPEAFNTLVGGEHRLSFRVAGDGDGGCDIVFSPRALEGIYDTVVSMGKTSSTIDIADRIATKADLSEAQSKVVGGGLAYVYSVTVDGTEIHEFGGPVTITIPFEPGYRVENVTVSHVKDDGSKVLMDSTYDGKVITVVTDHFSVYLVSYTVPHADMGWVLWIAVLIVLALTLNLLRMGCRGAAYTFPAPKWGWRTWAEIIIILAVSLLMFWRAWVLLDLSIPQIPSLPEGWWLCIPPVIVAVLALNLLRSALKGGRN